MASARRDVVFDVTKFVGVELLDVAVVPERPPDVQPLETKGPEGIGFQFIHCEVADSFPVTLSQVEWAAQDPGVAHPALRDLRRLVTASMVRDWVAAHEDVVPVVPTDEKIGFMICC